MTLYIHTPFRYIQVLEEQIYKRKINIRDLTIHIEKLIQSCTEYAIGILNNLNNLESNDDDNHITMLLYNLLGDIFLTSHIISIIELVQEFRLIVNTILTKIGDNLYSYIGIQYNIITFIHNSVVKIVIK